MQQSKYPYKVLFVEDEKDTRDNYTEYLNGIFEEVCEAEDGEMAYKLYKEKNPDILIVDINIPKLNGLDLIKKIREEDFTSKAIVLTAHEDIALLHQAISLRLTKYLVKPVSRKAFKESLDLAISEIDNIPKYSKKEIIKIEELEYKAKYDSLTDLPNRYFFDEQIESKLKSAKVSGIKFGFIIMDVDYFKKINDTYGHDVGDEVLKKLGNILKSVTRKDDAISRWGGEEFVLLANGSKDENFIEIIKKIQDSIKETSFAPVDKVRLSFGVSIYKEGDIKYSIQKRADDALFCSKKRGRDRFEFKL